MHSHPDPHPPTPHPLVGWLKARGLALPAWAALECVRPVGWLLAHLCWLAEPLGRGLGVERTVGELATLLASPEQLAALRDALAPEGEPR